MEKRQSIIILTIKPATEHPMRRSKAESVRKNIIMSTTIPISSSSGQMRRNFMIREQSTVMMKMVTGLKNGIKPMQRNR